MSFVLSKTAGVAAATGCPPALTVPDGYTSPFLTDPVSKGTWFGAAWIPVTTFLNGWVNFGGTNQIARYRKIGDIVYIEGLVKSGTIGVAVFQLPVGYRPTGDLHFATSSLDAYGSGSVSAGSGNVSAAVGSSSWFSLQCQFAVSA